jgi:hypothetical protein
MSTFRSEQLRQPLNITGSLYGTASYADTASLAPNYVLNSATSSFVTNTQTSSFVTNSQTSSFVLNSQTSSMTVATASYVTASAVNGTVTSASYALTASHALNGGGGTATLTSSLLTNVTVGGLASGTSYAIGTTLESIFRTMLVTYIAPTISAFTLKNGASTVFFSTDYVEVSSSLTFNTASFTATADNPNGRFAYSASFTSSGASTGDFNYYFGNDVLGTSNNLGLGSSRVINRSSDGTITFTLRTRNPQTDAVISRTANLIHIYPYFYGMSATDYSITGNLVNDGDLTKLITPLNNQIVPLSGTSKYVYFAYPASYGDLTSIKDGNGFEVFSSFTKYTRNQNGASGFWTGVSYNIYKSNITTISPAQNYTFTY